FLGDAAWALVDRFWICLRLHINPIFSGSVIINGFFFVAVYAATAACTFGASSSFELTVEAGRHDRNNVAVRVPMQHGQIGNEPICSVRLARADGQLIPAQWTGPSLTSSAAGEVHFILPHLTAGESLQLKGTLSTQPAAAGGLTWQDQPGHHVDL